MIYWICRGLTRGISYNAEGTSHICPIPSFLNNYFKTEMVASFGGGDMAIKVVHANCAYVGYLVWQSHTHSLTYSLTHKLGFCFSTGHSEFRLSCSGNDTIVSYDKF